MTDLSYGPFISRKQAKAQGLKQYFTGSTCKSGHSEPRYTVNAECRECANQRAKERGAKLYADPAQKAKILARNKSRYDNDKDFVARKVKQQWNRRRSNPTLKIEDTLRARVGIAIRKQFGVKATKTTDLIGCSIKKIRQHLESQFLPGMSWENHGKWHIDHIRPCASFDLTDPEQQKQCFHYTNLQPLWAADNLAKSDNWEAA